MICSKLFSDIYCFNNSFVNLLLFSNSGVANISEVIVFHAVISRPMETPWSPNIHGLPGK